MRQEFGIARGGRGQKHSRGCDSRENEEGFKRPFSLLLFPLSPFYGTHTSAVSIIASIRKRRRESEKERERKKTKARISEPFAKGRMSFSVVFNVADRTVAW